MQNTASLIVDYGLTIIYGIAVPLLVVLVERWIRNRQSL